MRKFELHQMALSPSKEITLMAVLRDSGMVKDRDKAKALVQKDRIKVRGSDKKFDSIHDMIKMDCREKILKIGGVGRLRIIQVDDELEGF